MFPCITFEPFERLAVLVGRALFITGRVLCGIFIGYVSVFSPVEFGIYKKLTGLQLLRSGVKMSKLKIAFCL